MYTPPSLTFPFLLCLAFSHRSIGKTLACYVCTPPSLHLLFPLHLLLPLPGYHSLQMHRHAIDPNKSSQILLTSCFLSSFFSFSFLFFLFFLPSRLSLLSRLPPYTSLYLSITCINISLGTNKPPAEKPAPRANTTFLNCITSPISLSFLSPLSLPSIPFLASFIMIWLVIVLLYNNQMETNCLNENFYM